MSKYNARRTWVEALGRWFASRREAEAAVALRAREQAGEIRRLRFQVPYDLTVNGQLVARYVADFVWDEPVEGGWWKPVVGDAKGFPTPLYKLKKKIFEALYGLRIAEL